MINNLFSIFDTATSIFLNINWISIFSNIFIFPLSFWLIKSRILNFLQLIISKFKSELKIILFNNFFNFNIIFFLSIFLLIFINNFIGLFPYIFTRSSHLIFALSFSLPLWIRLILFGWINNINFIFAHIIPQRTPIILIPFIVIIETIRNIIRPITLAIRLTANIIAGHLLLTLLRQTALTNFWVSIIIIIIQIILLVLELSVSIIQAYVFSILRTLYTKETS